MKLIMAGSALFLSVMFAGCASRPQAAVETPKTYDTGLKLVPRSPSEPKPQPVITPKRTIPDNWGYVIVDELGKKSNSSELTEYMDNIHEYVYKTWRPILNEYVEMMPLIKGGVKKHLLWITSDGTYTIREIAPSKNDDLINLSSSLAQDYQLSQISSKTLRNLKLEPLPNGMKSLMLTITFVYRQN